MLYCCLSTLDLCNKFLKVISGLEWITVNERNFKRLFFCKVWFIYSSSVHISTIKTIARSICMFINECLLVGASIPRKRLLVNLL